MKQVKGLGTSDWQLSLESEKVFWQRDKERICSEWWLSIKKRRASQLKEWLSSFIPLNDSSMILQIGSGAEGEINFLGVGHRFAIDPLADFFKAEFSEILDPAVNFRAGVGEDLPYEDNTFDLVIIYNALDHTYDPKKVLSGINRVLKSGGISHIAVHVYPAVWLPPLKLLKSIQGSKDHLLRYTAGRIKSELRANSLQLLGTRYGGKDELSIPDWLALTTQLRIARRVGLCAPMFHVLAKKKMISIK